MTTTRGSFPDWLPDATRIYLRHTEDGHSIRAIAREEGCHASTVLRRIRACENRRDDPLIDDALTRFGRMRGTPDETPLLNDTTEKDHHMTAPLRHAQGKLADEATV
ncbi:MAG: helix-turn-helix domain-containing protein, partial [Albidovulum sp.]